MPEEKALKILLVLPLYGGSLPIGLYCAKALEDIGHKVELFEASEFQSAYVALQNLKVSAERNEFLQNSFAHLLSEAVYAKAERYSPDLVLALAQAPLSRAVLKRFQRDKIPTAMWFVEDYKLFTYWRAYANLYDYFFVIQKEPFLTLLKEGGHKNAYYLPLAALPSFHKSLELTASEKTKYSSDISFLGAGYANRRLEFRKLIGYDFKIWGSDWEGETILRKHIQNNGIRVSPEESVRIYNATKININLHSSVKTSNQVQGDFVNPRTFELASMGAFQLTDKRSLTAELFDITSDKKELVTFENFSEVPALIDYYLAHAEERKEIAQRAKQKIVKEHNYQNRMQALLKTIATTNTDFGNKETDTNIFPNIPKELQNDMKILFEKLSLPPSASFEDIISSLRQEQGKLTSLETSLLFLDEWRKQYG